MQRPHEDAVNDLRDAGVFGVGHEGARRRLAGGRRPRRAVIAWEGRDSGEARMVYAASDEGEVSLAEIKGRGTSLGQSRLAGQFAENHAMTVSYFRAVKDAPSLKRSKNRQSPVERRATVEGSRWVAFANSAAQVSR